MTLQPSKEATILGLSEEIGKALADLEARLDTRLDEIIDNLLDNHKRLEGQ